MATNPRVELPIGGKIAGKSTEYEILERINDGANGVVYRARTGAGDIFALKLFSLRDPVSLEDHEKFRKSFKNEVTKTRLVSHWAVIGVRDWGEVNLEGLSTPFWVMELAPSDLRKVLDADSLGLFARCFFSAVLCEAVDYINTRGQIHRDIKPENILLDATGLPKIADLGIAEFIPDFDKKALEGYEVYTEPVDARRPKHYFSPEQMRREIVKDKNPGNFELLKEVDLSRSDLFQLGKVVTEVFTGINPGGQLHPRSRAMQVAPKPVRNLLIRMQSHEMDERPSLENCVAIFYGQAALSLWNAKDEFLRLAKKRSNREREVFLAAFRNGDAADPHGVFSNLEQASTLLARWEKRGLIQGRLHGGKPGGHRLALTPFGRDVRDFLALREPWLRLIQTYRTLGRAPSHRLHEWGTEAWVYENPRRATSPEQLAFCPKRANDWSSYILCAPMNIGGRWWAEVYEGDQPSGFVFPERLIGFQAPRWVKSGDSPRAALAAVRSELLEAGIPKTRADKAIAKVLALAAKQAAEEKTS